MSILLPLARRRGANIRLWQIEVCYHIVNIVKELTIDDDEERVAYIRSIATLILVNR